MFSLEIYELLLNVQTFVAQLLYEGPTYLGESVRILMNSVANQLLAVSELLAMVGMRPRRDFLARFGTS
jgi:hypothetical protein